MPGCRSSPGAAGEDHEGETDAESEEESEEDFSSDSSASSLSEEDAASLCDDPCSWATRDSSHTIQDLLARHTQLLPTRQPSRQTISAYQVGTHCVVDST